MKYNQFIFDSCVFDRAKKELALHYSLDGTLRFTETYRFNFEFAPYDENVLNRAFDLLFFMAGVSYYKTYIPAEIVVRTGVMDEKIANFLAKTYQKGLGEFWYVNQLDPRTIVPFKTTVSETLNMLSNSGAGKLVGIGGGKDSLVSVELLRNQDTNLATWSMDHEKQLKPLVERIGLPHKWVERTWDPQLLGLNEQGALNGHVPISALFACVGVVVAILSGKRDVVVSNERSANEPTLRYQDVDINHQYSKSLEFENDFQALLQHLFGDTIRYYSLLRPISEVRIAEIFTEVGFEKYKDVFSSCNRAYVHTSDHMSWCGECAKCAFTFMALSPFIEKEHLAELWGGKNLLLDPILEQTYRQLLGIDGDKPLDCIGEIEESRAAMDLAKKIYPELEKYQYEIAPDYDFRSLAGHNMPSDVFELIKDKL